MSSSNLTAGTVLTLLLLLLLSAGTTAAPLSICEVPKEYTTSPPLVKGEPVEIAVDLVVLDIIEIDSVKEFFTLYYTVDLRWQDERLSAENLGYSLAGCSLEEEDIWHARIGLLNLQSTNVVYFRDIRVDAHGAVREGWRLQTRLSSDFDVHDFPFDKQRLMMRVASFGYGPESVRFTEYSGHSSSGEGLDSAGWNIIDLRLDVDIPPTKAGGSQFSQFGLHIDISRNAGYYIWKFVVPLCFILLMAFSVFWLDPVSFGNQIGISTAAVFTLVAFLLGLRQGMPQVAYLNRMDLLVLSATILVFLSLAEVVVVSRLVAQAREELARRIDWHCRWIYLSIFSYMLYRFFANTS